MRILVLNAGSSSLKTSVVVEPGDRSEGSRTEALPHDQDWADALRAVLTTAAEVEAVGHRVVHGGPRHAGSVVISEAVMTELEQLRDLAPLHNAPALDAMAAARRILPDVPHVAAFDTAFHATLPEEAITYPVPFEWRDELGVRRYGFHGLSVAWATERAADLLGRPVADLRLVVAHLGSGCSVTAVDGGRSADTSMGMTPLEGLMMATRSGSVDPGILLDLLGRGDMSLRELRDALQHQSGLAGVSGVSGDMRDVQAGADGGDERAQLALTMFARRAAAGIAAAATTMPTLDAVVFTGGIGEHAAGVRTAVCARLGTLGVPSELAGSDDGDDRVLSEPHSPVAVLRVVAREDVVIAREAARLLSG